MGRTAQCLSVLLLTGAGICSGQGLPSITTSSLPNGTTGGPYSVTLGVSGGVPPYANWTVGAGTLPPGLSLNASTGTIAGTPGASGVFNFWVVVTDSAGGIAPAQALSITTSAPAIVSPAITQLSGPIATPYSLELAGAGGTPPYINWTIASGQLPPGLALNSSTGIISGTPTVVGAYTVSVVMQDSTGVSCSPLPMTIVAGFAIITNSVPKATLTAPYSVQLNTGGGAPPYAAWTVSSGTLPPGLTLAAATGLLSGTPTATGGYSFGVTVTDSANNVSLPQNFSIPVAAVPAISTASLPSGIPGIPYSSILSLSGGTSPITWAVSHGNLPDGLVLSAATGLIHGTPQSAAGTNFNFEVQATDALGVVSASQPLSIAITQASLTFAPSSLTFTLRPDDSTAPPPQSVSIFSVSSAVTFTASGTTMSGGNWLNVSGGGRTPGSILVSINAAGLTPNTTYQGAITIKGQNVTTVTIPVSLIVAATGPAQMSVSPPSLSLSYVQGNAPDQRYLMVSNNGSGAVHYTATAITQTCGGSWLALLGNTGTATANNAGVIPLLVSPGGLGDKTCVGEIDVSAAETPGQNQRIAVTMSVSSQSQSLQLTQAGMAFQAGGGSTPSSQSFSVLNTGMVSMNWTASAQTLSGGNWLSVTPSSGTSTYGVLPSPVTVSVNPQGLAPGQYYGTVQVASSTVGNSPQNVSVMLNVLASTPVTPPVSPAGVILVGQPTGSSQTEIVTLANPWSTVVNYTSAVVTDNRVSWLSQTPSSGAIPSGGTSTLSLQANTRGLGAGLQHGVLRVAFADGTVHTVDVYLVIPATAVANVRTGELQANAIAQACPAGSSGVAAVFQSPEPGFVVAAQTPVTIKVTARECSSGKMIKQSGGAAVQVFVGQDGPALPLVEDGAGNWAGTWTPAAAASSVLLMARVDQYVGSIGSVVSAQNVITGTVVAPPPGAPGVITRIVNGANSSYPGSVTRGGYVSLYGVAMGDSVASAPNPPYPSNLAGTQVLLQGQNLPLYFVSDTQINAMIPAGVNANERQQLLVLRNGTQSSSVDVRVFPDGSSGP